MRRQAANNRCGNVNGRRTSVGISSQVLGGDLEFFYFTVLSAKGGRVAVVGQASAFRVRILVGTGRFELPTCRLGGGRSIHLSYVPTHKDCTVLFSLLSSVGRASACQSERSSDVLSPQPLAPDIPPVMHPLKLDVPHPFVRRGKLK